MDGTQLIGHPGSESIGAPSLFVSDGRLLVFGGCYSNLEATRAVFEAAKDLGIPAGQMICTGDVVAYGADAAATVEMIRRSGVRVVMGNCEESLGTDAADCGCGYEEGSACDRLSDSWYSHARAQLSDGDKAWMRSLPRRIDVLIGGRRLAVVHGGVDSINSFSFASSDADGLSREIDLAQCDGVIGGHCGLPFTRTVEGRLWHNSGAIGMPANDGTARTWYSLIAATPHGLAIEHRALSYDHETASAKMRRAGLAEGYAAALETGLWPSCDVLPADELAQRGAAIAPGKIDWTNQEGDAHSVWPKRPRAPLRAKFSDPEITATGERRASIALARLQTLWINTGTLCNLSCLGCYIDSSPRNDRLAYISRAEVRAYLAETANLHPACSEIGFTGGEPFMNPDMLGMLEDALAGGWRALVLTNAMKPMEHVRDGLLALHRRFPAKLAIRVSLDHYTQVGHERIRGRASWQPALDGITWLARNGFDLALASRTVHGESETEMRARFQTLCDDLGVALDTRDPARLVLFPEMDETADVPEITDRCWDLLGVDPNAIMCATSRMVIKRKDAAHPTVVACTLLPYDEQFDFGARLADSDVPVKLNHRHCASFCVLGGASCSAGSAS